MALDDPFSGRWDAGQTAEWLSRSKAVPAADMRAALVRLENSLTPAPREWLGKRLPVLWTTYMPARPVDPGALTVWLIETARLLGDLPHDIAGHSIDEAIKAGKSGFMPTVGEIRSIADPLVAVRLKQIRRLHRLLEARAPADQAASGAGI